MRFFLDNCLPPSFAPALTILAARQGNDIVHLRDRFDPATPDPEWIRALGREGD